MAGVKDKELLTHSGFPLGINNTSKEHDLPRNEAGAVIALRDALNTNLSPTGKPSLREGYALVAAAVNGHSAFSDDYLPFGFMVDGDTMYVVHDDESRDAIVTGLAPGLPVSYVRINDAVLWSNSVQCGQITVSLETMRWCPPHPNGQVTLAVGAGALDAGSYQVTVTFFDEFGRESGALRAAMLDVPENGALEVGSIPQPPPGCRIRLYCTSGNDGVLRAAVNLAAGVTSYTITQRAEGRPLDTLLLRPMPPGQLVAYGNSRQFVARGKEVLYSPPLRYGMVNPRVGRVSFSERVDMIAFVGDGSDGAGLFVSDSKRTYWLGGANPADWKQVIAYSHGAIPGQIAWAPGDMWGLETKQPLPVWQARNGRLVVGLPGGGVYLPQPGEGEPTAVFDDATHAALMFSETPGDRRVISALKGASSTSFAMKDQLIAREYRHEKP
jgi:hypothetical protein